MRLVKKSGQDRLEVFSFRFSLDLVGLRPCRGSGGKSLPTAGSMTEELVTLSVVERISTCGMQIFNKEFFALLFVLMYSQYSEDRDTSTFFMHWTSDDVIFMNN